MRSSRYQELLNNFCAHTDVNHFTVSIKNHKNKDGMDLPERRRSLWKGNWHSSVSLECYFTAENRVIKKKDDII